MQTFFDDFEITGDSRIGNDGIFRTTGRFARVGVQSYFDAAGNRVRRFRPPAEVQKIADAGFMPVITLDHPSDSNGNFTLVDKANVEKLKKGFSSPPIFKDGWLHGSIAIDDKDAIAKARTSHKYFSDGYSATISPVAGIFVDIHGYVGDAGLAYEYDETMSDMQINHRAIVSNPRAGKLAVMDSEDSTIMPDDKTYEITFGDQKVSVNKAQFDAYQATQAAQKTLVVDTDSTFDAQTMETEFAKRHEAYDAACQYLPQGTAFDAGKSADDWMRAAFDAKGIDHRQFTDLKSAFLGMQAQTGPSAVESFGYHLDAIRRGPVQDSRSNQQKPKQEDILADLADAQHQEFEYLSSGFEQAKELYGAVR